MADYFSSKKLGTGAENTYQNWLMLGYSWSGIIYLLTMDNFSFSSHIHMVTYFPLHFCDQVTIKKRYCI